ncbi:hypothetical protein [Lacisediminihabitans sp. H27-G8]|uniref:hypothetical protein n=1 Tax=Lacisediminihabitans sp. H27-G8 TaxID=3111909 RepID=UPI0038FBF545
MSNTAMQMMEMHSDAMQGMDMGAMQECIEACSACEQACTMCAGSMAMSAEMAMCAAMCQNSADMANTMMRMMLRPNGMNGPAMMAMLQAMVVAGMSCADECEAMAGMSADCAMCAEVCRQCAMACQKMMDSMLAA